MKLPFSITIQRKLTFIILATCSISLLLAVGALVVMEAIHGRQLVLDRLEAQVRYIAERCAPALALEQHEIAFQVIEALDVDPYVAVACVFNSETNLIAHHVASGLSESERQTYDFDLRPAEPKRPLEFIEPIELGDQRLGYVYLVGKSHPLKQGLLYVMGIGVFALLFALGAAVLLSAYLQKFVSQPIIEIAAIANEVIRTKDYGLRAPKRSDDELGRLIEIINEMLQTIQSREEELRRAHQALEARVEERSRKLSLTSETLEREITKRQRVRNELVELNSKLIEATRRAGMAEVASAILHNVGNVLNSINVSAGVIRQRLEESELSDFKAVVELIGSHRETLPQFIASDPRGGKLPDYLDAFAKHLSHEEALLAEEVESLVRNVEHVKEIIATQQRHAGGIGLAEKEPLDTLVSEILTLYSSMLRQSGILLIAEYESCPEVTTERHKVIQILGNLMLNARDSLLRCTSPSKQIRVTTRVTAEHRVAVQVADNGVGIKKEDLRWIFTHGFTTKKDGHGLGLHSCAITAQELNGSLRVISEGQGRGATFILELPIN